MVCAYPDDLGSIPETQLLKARGLQERSRFIADNIRVIRTLIESHQAIGVLPEYLCGELLADRRLRATLLPRHRDVWLLGAKPSEARCRRAGGDRLVARRLPGICQGVGAGSATR